MIVPLEKTIETLCKALGETKAAKALKSLAPQTIMGVPVYDSEEIKAAIKQHQTTEQLAEVESTQAEQLKATAFLQEIINEHKNK